MQGKIILEISAEFEPEDGEQFNKVMEIAKSAVESLRENTGDVEASVVLKGDVELDL
jgi:hypothetical protein